MKRTIKEVYDLIKEKRDNAEKDYKNTGGAEIIKASILYGEKTAYEDVLCLIESSHLLEK